MPFRYTYRGQDLTDLPKTSQDLIENRDTELETWVNAAIPVGGIVRWHNAIAAPKGWLATNGGSVSRLTYPALFAVIGYTYGGSGANFTLPTVTDSIIRY
jgi:hypothetical protein